MFEHATAYGLKRLRSGLKPFKNFWLDLLEELRRESKPRLDKELKTSRIGNFENWDPFCLASIKLPNSLLKLLLELNSRILEARIRKGA